MLNVAQPEMLVTYFYVCDSVVNSIEPFDVAIKVLLVCNASLIQEIAKKANNVWLCEV